MSQKEKTWCKALAETTDDINRRRIDARGGFTIASTYRAPADTTSQVDETSIAYLKDGDWVERPARLFRSLLAETIRARGKRLVVEDDAEARGNLHLSGRLIALGYDAHTRSAVVRYDALWQDASGAIAMRRFEAVEKDVAPKASAVAPAINRAANRVAADVADWVK